MSTANMVIENVYNNYYNFVNSIINTPDLQNFKYNNYYQEVLEHISYEQGFEYLNLIKRLSNLSETDIINYCMKNDKIGGGYKYNYGFVITSPSNFRYILHSHLILSYISNLNINNINFVEIGGGYGGLCLAIALLSNKYKIQINNYNLIDLPSVSLLQKKYLDLNNVNCTINTFSAFNYGSEISISNNVFLISNYAFSEISSEYQVNYIKNLFPKVHHGFMVWNKIPLYNFGFNYKQENEYPQTGQTNKYIYF